MITVTDYIKKVTYKIRLGVIQITRDTLKGEGGMRDNVIK